VVGGLHFLFHLYQFVIIQSSRNSIKVSIFILEQIKCGYTWFRFFTGLLHTLIKIVKKANDIGLVAELAIYLFINSHIIHHIIEVLLDIVY